jgi:hypothetical protein
MQEPPRNAEEAAALQAEILQLRALLAHVEAACRQRGLLSANAGTADGGKQEDAPAGGAEAPDSSQGGRPAGAAGEPGLALLAMEGTFDGLDAYMKERGYR